MTTRELRALQEMANSGSTTRKTDVAIDAQARERAEGWVSDLARELGEAEQVLRTLGGFCDEGLGQAIVGAIGISLMEAQQQVGPLRQAIRDLPEIEGGRDA